MQKIIKSSFWSGCKNLQKNMLVHPWMVKLIRTIIWYAFGNIPSNKLREKLAILSEILAPTDRLIKTSRFSVLIWKCPYLAWLHDIFILLLIFSHIEMYISCSQSYAELSTYYVLLMKQFFLLYEFIYKVSHIRMQLIWICKCV